MEEPNAGPSFLSWVHSGDLHIRQAHDENYLDFLELIDDVNTYLGTDVDFAFLPGDTPTMVRRTNTSWFGAL